MKCFVGIYTFAQNVKPTVLVDCESDSGSAQRLARTGNG